MKVYLTFDIEVWCDGWSDLDQRFPASFERYYYGSSKAGRYALPKTLEILDRHGLTGVFFVEPLFSARFGRQYLDLVTGMIAQARQDIQLHLHPEWTDEISPAILADVATKRQHLTYYSEQEQTTLIAVARRLLEASKGGPIQAFRAGSYAVNHDTYRALRHNGILLDSSINAAFDHSGGSLGDLQSFPSGRTIEGVVTHPVTSFRDGLGRLRPAQVNACGAAEMQRALLDAHRRGLGHFVVVSHNFEMLKPGSVDPDWYVVRRFEALCAFLSSRPDLFEVGPFSMPPLDRAAPAEAVVADPRPCAPAWATARRLAEQVVRRLG